MLKAFDIRRRWIDPLAGKLLPDDSSEGAAVPVMYGTQLLNAKMIAQGPANAPELKRFWYAFAHGKIRFIGLQTELFNYGIRNGVDIESMFDYFYDGDPTTAVADIDVPPDDWMTELYSIYAPSTNMSLPPLIGICHAGCTFAADFWGSWASMQETLLNEKPPALKVIARRDLSSSPITNYEIIKTGTGTYTGDLDYGDNPAAVIYDLLTNTQYGLSVDPDTIDLASFQAAADYFYEENFGVNFTIKQLNAVRQTIDAIETNVGCQLALTDNGEFKLIATYSTSGLTVQATLTKDDFLDFKTTTQSWDETINRLDAKTGQAFHIEYDPALETFEVSDLSDLPKDVGLSIYNQSNVLLTGETRKSVVDLTMHREPLTASKRLYQLLREVSFPRTTVSGTVGLQHLKYHPGEVLRIIHDDYAINAPFRIRHRTLDEQDKGRVSLTLDRISDAEYDSFYTASGYSDQTSSAIASTTEILYFDPYSWTSQVSTGVYNNLGRVRVIWGEGQLMQGWLLTNFEHPYGPYRCIVNDEGGGLISVSLRSLGLGADIDFTPIVEANSLGEMFIRVWESD